MESSNWYFYRKKGNITMVDYTKRKIKMYAGLYKFNVKNKS